MIRQRVARLAQRMAQQPQYPTQGATLFVDLATRRVDHVCYVRREVVTTFLEGRGANMAILYNLLDPSLEPLDPQVPLQLSAGLLTGIVPAAARGQVTGWSPETGFLMDSSGGDFFPSYLKLQGIDRLVLYGRAEGWIYLYIEGGAVEFRDASGYVGLDNLELRARVARDLEGRFGAGLAMANITRAGENGVLSAGIMGGEKAIWARGGTGAKMGSLRLKAIVLRGFEARRGAGEHPRRVKATNKQLARQVLATGVVKHALQVRGTPFLYKPSRLLGAIGAKNHQQTSWTEALDAEHLDPYRTGMTGCFRCPVRCRPQNELPGAGAHQRGEGPDYVTVGKLGALVGVSEIAEVVRLSNLVNDLGLDSASLGSAIAWATELFERGIITRADTGGLELEWGNAELIAHLARLTASREGFGDVLADSARAVDTGRYPPAALDFRLAVKGLMQSDPHDARIIKAFALGLAVATRGMDHLRNRPTLEINARINDDPAYKRSLYGGAVAAAPNAYEGKERAVRTCEDVFAVGDAVGLCRFTTKLFNSPNLIGLDELGAQIRNVTGLELTSAELQQIGRNITGLERMINHRLGVRREHDTLPRRWFEEGATAGPFTGERIAAAEFDALLGRFYALTDLDDQGRPSLAWRARLARVVTGFAVVVELPVRPEPGATATAGGEREILICEPVATVGELLREVTRQQPWVGDLLDEGLLAVALNGEILLRRRDDRAVGSGDRIELLTAFAGG